MACTTSSTSDDLFSGTVQSATLDNVVCINTGFETLASPCAEGAGTGGTTRRGGGGGGGFSSGGGGGGERVAFADGGAFLVAPMTGNELETTTKVLSGFEHGGHAATGGKFAEVSASGGGAAGYVRRSASLLSLGLSMHTFGCTCATCCCDGAPIFSDTGRSGGATVSSHAAFRPASCTGNSAAFTT